MTLDEAIRDKNRPLSVAPAEWMEYQKAKDADEEVLFDEEASRIVRDEHAVTSPLPESTHEDVDSDDAVVTPSDRLEIGIEQMVIGCKMAIRALQELSRIDSGQSDKYDKIGTYIRNGVSPYLAEAMKAFRG